MTNSCCSCPVCGASVTFGAARCPDCLRWLRWSAGGRQVRNWLTLFALGLLGLVLLSMLGLMLGLSQLAMVSIEIAMIGALASVLGVDGWLSIRSGVDRSKARVSHGLEARITGWVKLAFAVGGVSLGVYALAVLPGLL